MSRVIRPLPGSPQTGRGLVLFPHAGGSPRFFRHWSGQIPGVRLLGVTYPGRDHRLGEPHPADLSTLADEVAVELAAVLGEDRDPVLFGHSMGAVVAHEVAHRLYADGWHPAVVVSGHDAPGVGVRRRPLHREPDGTLVDDLVRLDDRNAEVFAQPELTELFLPAIREDYRMVETHRPPRRDARLPRLLVINGDEDPEVSHEGAEAWAAHARRFDGVRLVPGDHFHHAAPRRDCCRVLHDYLFDDLVLNERSTG